MNQKGNQNVNFNKKRITEITLKKSFIAAKCQMNGMNDRMNVGK